MRKYRLIGLGLAMAALAWPLLAHGDDWPQWRGPDRTGVSKEKGLLKKWPDKGPDLAWTFSDAGTGYSAPAVVGDRVYVLGARKGDEYVIALDAANNGKEAWSVKIGKVYDFKGNTWVNGPNTTPSVDGDLLYAVGSQGILVCVNVKDKKEVWRKDMVNDKDMAGRVNDVQIKGNKMGWGYSGSPLVDGKQVICTPGGPKGLLAAFDKTSGDLIWQSKEVPEDATYSSPIVAEVGGVRQYIAMTQDGAVGVAAKDGSLLWRYQRKKYADIVAPTPIFHNNHVFLTSWVDGPDLIKLEVADQKFTAKKVYGPSAKIKFSNQHGGVVLVDGCVYGAQLESGWMCMAFETGAEKWFTTRDLHAGSVTYADGHLYCLTEDEGEVALVEATPKEYKEISRFELPQKSTLRKPGGRVWTHPVVANGCLYLRDQELLFCYKVK
jgi:outer membrane protein assembly factor BamB